MNKQELINKYNKDLFNFHPKSVMLDYEMQLFLEKAGVHLFNPDYPERIIDKDLMVAEASVRGYFYSNFSHVWKKKNL